MSRIVLIGGHGKVVRLLTPRLVRGGHQVTALFRNPAHADRGVSRGNVAQVIAAALATPATIGKTVGFIDGQCRSGRHWRSWNERQTYRHATGVWSGPA
ncbi:hypothetical protein ACFQS6_10405 [Xanthomonas populi]|uniref:hypothetical protein n=1 Tax=Xanthomonas populi TaxID=53414 RepID=UPI0026D0DD30